MEWSIIIPVRNERSQLAGLLDHLDIFRDRAELIVVDGGSSDDGLDLLRDRCDNLLVTEPGRARQMNAGAAVARGRHLLFLHADTRIPGLPADSGKPGDDLQWGFHPVRFSGDSVAMAVIAGFMNRRSRLTRVATGDQAIFVNRALFESINGFAQIPLMEDVEISKRLRRHAVPTVQSRPVVTSPRRWMEHGVIKTVLTMWTLRLAYVCGASPQRLARIYYG